MRKRSRAKKNDSPTPSLAGGNCCPCSASPPRRLPPLRRPCCSSWPAPTCCRASSARCCAWATTARVFALSPLTPSNARYCVSSAHRITRSCAPRPGRPRRRAHCLSRKCARVWIQAGYTHPLLTQLQPPPGQVVLMRPPRSWQFVEEAPFRDIYEILEFTLPQPAAPCAKSRRNNGCASPCAGRRWGARRGRVVGAARTRFGATRRTGARRGMTCCCAPARSRSAIRADSGFTCCACGRRSCRRRCWCCPTR